MSKNTEVDPHPPCFSPDFVSRISGRGYAFWGKLRRLLFPLASDFAEERDFSYDKKAIERKIVARFSCGNVRLQQGRYITQEEIDAGLRRCREYAEKYGD